MKIGLIGGSGLGRTFDAQGGVRHEMDTPFGRPSDVLIESEWEGVPVVFLSRHGPGHLLNPSQVPYRANLFALKQLGCTHVLASGAVGSLREEYRPRDLVVPDQIIDKTTRRAGTFYDKAAVHVAFAEPFCPLLRSVLVEAGAQSEVRRDFTVHSQGCYMAMEGPAFSTRAESLMHRLWGGGLIGMTLMPEAKLAREAEMAYAAVALVTDYDCWKPAETSTDPHALLKEIIGHLEAATANALGLLKKTVALMAGRREVMMQSPALGALELGIWSDKSKIDSNEVERLRPLWGRYFMEETK
jgi:5'-methylthioadenosine phosphorylase